MKAGLIFHYMTYITCDVCWVTNILTVNQICNQLESAYALIPQNPCEIYQFSVECHGDVAIWCLKNHELEEF